MCYLLGERVDIRHLFKSEKKFTEKICGFGLHIAFEFQNKINFIFKKFYEFKLFFMCFTSDFYEISFNVW